MHTLYYFAISLNQSLRTQSHSQLVSITWYIAVKSLYHLWFGDTCTYMYVGVSYYISLHQCVKHAR